MATQDFKNKAEVIGDALLMERTILENKRRLAMKMAIVENAKLQVKTKDPIALPYIEKIHSGPPIQAQAAKAVLDTLDEAQEKNDEANEQAQVEDTEREANDMAHAVNQARLTQEIEERQQASRRKYQIKKTKSVTDVLKNTGIGAGIFGAGVLGSLGGFTTLFG